MLKEKTNPYNIVLLPLVILFSGCGGGDAEDKVAPTITMESSLPSVIPSSNTSLIIETSEAGTWRFESGICQSNSNQIISQPGRTEIVLTDLIDEYQYSNCSISVTDSSGNKSNVITLEAFYVSDSKAHEILDRYVKLDNRGIPLEVQNFRYDSGGSYSEGNKWDCVLDKDTNLTWEIKSIDGGLRHKEWGYMNTTSRDWPLTRGLDEGSCYSDIGNKTEELCHTEKYITEINQIKLCGYSDWRLPNNGVGFGETIYELPSLLTCSVSHYNDPDCPNSGPHINKNYFPNTINASYWSNKTTGGGTWFVNFSNGRFNISTSNNSPYHVRLVR